jgi:hypothetical protein
MIHRRDKYSFRMARDWPAILRRASQMIACNMQPTRSEYGSKDMGPSQPCAHPRPRSLVEFNATGFLPVETPRRIMFRGLNENDGTQNGSDRIRCDPDFPGLGCRESTNIRTCVRVDCRCARWRDNHQMRQRLRTVLGGAGSQCECHTDDGFHISMHGATLLVGSGWGLA